MSKSMAHGESPLRSPGPPRSASPEDHNSPKQLSKSQVIDPSEIPLAHRGTSASVAVVGGQVFRKTSAINQEDPHHDDKKWEEENHNNSVEDKVMLRGWFECRKKRRFAKYKKEWKPKYFLLLADSLVFFDSVEDKMMRGKYPLLGAEVKTWRVYKEGAVPVDRHLQDKEFSVSKTKSLIKVSSNTEQFDLPEDRTLVLIAADGQTLYIRFMTTVEMNAWYDAFEECAKKLISKYTPTFESHGIMITLLTAGKDGEGILSFNLEGESGELRWKFWRSYQEFQKIHRDCVEQVIVKPATPPDLPPLPADESNMRGFLEDMKEYLRTLVRIEAVAQSPLFLEFAGVVSTRNAGASIAPNVRHVFSWEHVLEICQTGDIILVSNTHWISQVQKTVTRADWDHVGLIVNIPTTAKRSLDKLFLVEATSADGVKKYPLRIRLAQMGENCTVGFRKLEWTENRDKLNALQKFIEEVEGKPYSLKGLINRDSTEKFFCSQLVIECYKALGVISDEAKAGSFLPGDFSAASKSLPFSNGCCFESEEALVTFEESLEVSKSRTAKEIEESKSSRRPDNSKSKKVASPEQKSISSPQAHPSAPELSSGISVRITGNARSPTPERQKH